jgi:hypothetical protein
VVLHRDVVQPGLVGRERLGDRRLRVLGAGNDEDPDLCHRGER